MKYRAVLGTKDSAIKQAYENILSHHVKDEFINFLGGRENAYSIVNFKGEDDEYFFGIGRIQRNDEYEYLFFWSEGFEPKDELFNEFSKEISTEEFLKICEEENIEME
ncbi:MAG TPA: hypothetical protein H9889_01870 [Candidatus Ignatzschineria merdigallinarum]|uniref:Uncharacterized protein n=1 Tax=Candidatus Ignatzschineria merdigallinarum TaxID=2838621 RepID=A0A9D1Q5Q0_9GAMM|nr:hypothetical protein [Candidatus Ignatzschineria merdigallinarum]